MKLFALIMAGGIGSRFWPRSKEKTPKQLLKIIGENTMIQSTVDRLDGIISKENIFICLSEHLEKYPLEKTLKDKFVNSSISPAKI